MIKFHTIVVISLFNLIYGSIRLEGAAFKDKCGSTVQNILKLSPSLHAKSTPNRQVIREVKLIKSKWLQISIAGTVVVGTIVASKAKYQKKSTLKKRKSGKKNHENKTFTTTEKVAILMVILTFGLVSSPIAT